MKMRTWLCIACVFTMAIVMSIGTANAADPEYQAPPEETLAHGVVEMTGTGGIVDVEYWAWDGGNGYYYYAYQVINVEFLPYIIHFNVQNPSGEQYWVVGNAGGGDPAQKIGWIPTQWTSAPIAVEWSAISTPAGSPAAIQVG